MSHSREFATLKRPVEVSGVGLHCGREITLRICPDERVGWHFRRLDLPDAPEVPARLEHVVATQHATVLQQGNARVSTTEHLLATLWSSGITHARIELDGEEVPILDGSARGWVELLEAAGREKVAGERPVWALIESVWHEGGGASVLGLPHLASDPAFRLSVAVDFGAAHAGAQVVDLSVDKGSFARELAPARTFTLLEWLEPLRRAGLIRGGSLENAILIDDSGPSSPWRFSNELARHKALDAVGDLALLMGDGGAFCGHLIATRAGHGAHCAWMERCRNQGVLKRI